MNTPKISPTFSPLLRNIDPDCKQDAIVIYKSERPPEEMPSRGDERRMQVMQQQSQENTDVVAKVAASYQNATGQSLNATKVGSGALPVAAVEVSQNTLPALAEQPEIVAVIPNQKIRLIEPQQIDYSDLMTQEEKQKMTWGLQVLEIPKMWEKTKGKGVKVSVLDTGVYSDHPALKDRVKDFIIIDPHGRRIQATPHFDAGEHGTHVCGTVAGGKTDKGVSIGVAPEADLLAGGVLIGNATLQTLIEGMAWSIEKGANIINMSLGFSYYEPLFAEVFDLLINQFDVLPVVAIGNENHGNSSSPGSAYNAFSIGALEKYPNDEFGIAFFSSGASLVFPEDAPNSWVTKPDVAAPGTQVYSCIPPVQQPNGIYEYTYMDGTSMATPHVAGVVALLMSACPKAPLSAIIQALKETAYHPGGEEMRPDNRWGWGRIQPVKALEALK
ncbi:MAG: S8 family serine peptidase [Lyngbya sp.]|nr:S8 family serine peptidase [Lyngbya sp.]